MQFMYFEEMVSEVFLIDVFGKMSKIHDLIGQLEIRLGERSSVEFVPAVLSVTKILVRRITRTLDSEKRIEFKELIHDLRNVTTAISGNVEMALRMWLNQQYQKLLSHISSLKVAVSTSRNMILKESSIFVAEGFVEKFASMENDPKTVSVEDVIQIALNLTQSRRVGNCHVNCLTPIRVNRYSTELSQILLNIFANAFDAMRLKKYSDESPNLKVYTDVVGDSLIIDVEDNGLGMDDETIERIFGEGFTTKRDGSGVGLSICKKNVNKIGGNINVKSTLGKGTIFTLTMPISL